jgi:hypothetical protein
VLHQNDRRTRMSLRQATHRAGFLAGLTLPYGRVV